MPHNFLRPLPVRVRPAHLEGARPYIRRALTTLGLNDRSTSLIRQYRLNQGVTKDAAERAVASILAGDIEQDRLFQPMFGGTEMLGLKRFACLRCTRGIVIEQIQHDQGNVCLRHRVWVGGSTSEQKPVSKAIVMAEREYRRLSRRVELPRFKEIQQLLADHAKLLDRRTTDADLYPTAVKVYKLLLNERLLRDVLDRSLTYRESYDMLDRYVAALVEQPSSVTDGLWLMLRPSALIVYETLQYGTSRGGVDPRDLRIPDGCATAAVPRPLEPFHRYLLPLRTTSAKRIHHELQVRVHRTPKPTTRTDFGGWLNGLAEMICKSGHRYKSSPSEVQASIQRESPGCHYCGLWRYPGETGMAQTDPLILAEFDRDANPGVDPESLKYVDKVHWRCIRAGHTAHTRVVTRRQLGCTACRQLDLVRVERPNYVGDPSSTFIIKFPLLAARYPATLNRGRTLEGVGHTSDEVLLWLCENGHVWPTSPQSVARGHGCCYCTNKYVWPGFNDVASEPTVGEEWDYAKNGATMPTEVYRLSKEHYNWKCVAYGHEWSATPFDRVKLGRGCPYCNGTSVLPGFNCMASKQPEAAALLHPYLNTFTATQVSPGTRRYGFFNCACGNIYYDHVSYVCTRKKKVCPDCRGGR